MAELQVNFIDKTWPRIEVELGESYAYGQIVPMILPDTLYLHDIYSASPGLGFGRMMLRALVESGISHGAEHFSAGVVTDEGLGFFKRVLDGSGINIERGQTFSVPIVEFARILDLQ